MTNTRTPAYAEMREPVLRHAPAFVGDFDPDFDPFRPGVSGDGAAHGTIAANADRELCVWLLPSGRWCASLSTNDYEFEASSIGRTPAEAICNLGCWLGISGY